MGVSVVNFGCRLNIAEADVVRAHAERAGLDDVVVVNTCAVTGEATRQARQTIRRLKRERPDARVVVTGCAAQIEPETFARMPEVAQVVGNEEKLRAETWSRLKEPAGETSRVVVNDVFAPRERQPHLAAGLPGKARAFVQVQTGCDHRCTFCVIPFGRGNSRSVPAGVVVDAIARLVSEGAREVVLTGVDITSYGRDLPGASGLGALVRTVLREVPDLPRLRLSSIDSVEADTDLLDVLASEPRFMPYLHLSLQAGDDLILKRMKRRHLRGDAIGFCAQARRLRPDIVFGADIIAGFPTETEAMFARSLDLVDECGLTHLHVFPFSPRPGTPAARMPPVPREVAKERARRLREKGAVALARHLDAQVGRTVEVLTETVETGRMVDFTPVRFQAPQPRGAFVRTTIAGHDGRELIAADQSAVA